MNLDKILKTGDEVRIKGNMDTYITTVEEITGENTFTILPPFKLGRQIIAKPGDIYSVTCVTERGLYIFESLVTEVDDSSQVVVLHLTATGETRKVQRRQAFRVNENITVNARKVMDDGSPDGKWVKTYSVDVSELGMLIRFNEPCELGQEMELTLRINLYGINDVITKVKSRVVRCIAIRHKEFPYLLGIRFEDLQEKARDSLIKLVVLSQRSKLTYKNLKRYR